jgi:hypothetical protein
MTVRVLVGRLNVRANGADAGTINSVEIHFVIGDIEQLQLFQQLLWLDASADQRAENHVAARTRETIKV